jgi:hypothetical protein
VIGIIREVVRELELQTSQNAVRKVARKSSHKMSAFFNVGEAILMSQERRYRNKLTEIVAEVAKCPNLNATSLLN